MKTGEQGKKELKNSLWKHGRIGIAIIIVGILLIIWGAPIQKLINSNKWFIILLAAGAILYVSWTEPVLFRDNKQNLRRTWYFVLIVGIVFLLKNNGFNTSYWQRYLYLTAMFIFVDLALFLTPTIKKFGGAEMETVQDIESINKQMQREIKKDQAKSEVFKSILARLQRDQLLKMDWDDPEEYRSDLESFLAIYGEQCMYEIMVFNDSIGETIPVQIETVLGIELKEEMAKSLTNDQIVEFDSQLVLIPFSHHLHPVVIAVLSQKESISQIDVAHIQDLSVIHTWQKTI